MFSMKLNAPALPCIRNVTAPFCQGHAIAGVKFPPQPGANERKGGVADVEDLRGGRRPAGYRAP